MFLTIIIFLIILGVLIFVHELGHFWVARRNGIKAEEFGLGFPPRIFGFFRKTGEKKWSFVRGGQNVVSENTIYSINWLPLGGFVKIKGENGENKEEEDSFSGKSPWTRVKVLFAGVLMNFILAWLLISLVLMLGAPEAIEKGEQIYPDSKIQIAQVITGTPAEISGLNIGDVISKTQTNPSGEKMSLKNIQDVQNFINSEKGREISLNIQRGGEDITVQAVPRTDAPEGQGALGISMVETVLVRYPWYSALGKGLISVGELMLAMLLAFWNILRGLLFGTGVGVDVSGPVGIAVMTKQVAALGFTYILQFAAIISINLGIINILPIPALDGGRILFVLIEKIKRKPVSQNVEQIFHMVGFAVLIALMVLVTFRDVLKIIR